MNLKKVAIDMSLNMAERLRIEREMMIDNLQKEVSPEKHEKIKTFFSIADKLTDILKEVSAIDHPLTPEVLIPLFAIISGITNANVIDELVHIIKTLDKMIDKEKNNGTNGTTNLH